MLTLDKKSAVIYRKQEEVSIPEKYQIIAAEAFKGNPKMKSLEIGPGMKKIGMRAFQGCIKLTKVRMAHSVNHLSEGCFSACPHLSEMQISSKVSEIPPSAFKEDRKLRQVNFADNSLLLKIREDAFNECASLAYIKIPESVRYIGKWVFHGCNRLRILEIWHDPEYIGPWIINKAAKIRCYQGSKVDVYCQESGFEVEYL